MELTRLPHERPGEERDGEAAKSDEDDVGGELNEEGVVTKREIEGLVDYWYVSYSSLIYAWMGRPLFDGCEERM